MISEDTLFRDVRVGDVLPYGEYGEWVVRVEKTTPETRRFTTVYFENRETRRVTRRDDPSSRPRVHKRAPEWAEETIRQSRERAEYMASVPD